MVGLSYEKKINLLNLARTESYKWIYVGSSPNLAFTFRGDESQSLNEKIQQTKMLVTCQRFGDLFLFGLVWQHSSVWTIRLYIRKVGSKSWLLTYLQQ